VDIAVFERGDSMHLIIYSSEFVATNRDIDAEIDDIIATSKRNNVALEVTGVMFFHGGRFLQVLEGNEEVVRALMAKIARDPRHTNIEYLFDDEIESRGLPGWNMDKFCLDEQDEVDVELLKQLSVGYRRMLKTETPFFVELIREFVEETEPSRVSAE
jgi:hypothetical protein